jgi:hypothetical protein
MDQTWWWIGFNAFVLVMLAVDLFVFHKDAPEVRVREAVVWSVVWGDPGVAIWRRGGGGRSDCNAREGTARIRPRRPP